MRVLVIGAGNMGFAYADALAKGKFVKKKEVMLLDHSKARIQGISKLNRFDLFIKPEQCIPQANVIFIAVKPHNCDQLFAQIRPLLNEEQIIISIMAGVTIQKIQEDLGIKKVVRAMPNLPAKVQKGMTSFTMSASISTIERLVVEQLINATGKSVHVENEEFLDASTGISGSGPAYVFYFMQSMVDAALEMGFSPNDGRHLVSQTFTGAIELFNQSELSPNDWINQVASEGGTTRAAIDSMEDNRVGELIKEAAQAAFSRAVELGKEYA